MREIKTIKPKETIKADLTILEMGDLFREALLYGRVRIATFNDGTFTAKIKRGVGKSDIETSFKCFPNPSQALMHAIDEAREWGLPLLEVTI